VTRYPYTPALGWSASRYHTFATCKRQYYYQYYGNRDGEVDQRKLKFLQNLTSGPLEVGNAVHATLAALTRRLRKTARPIDVERFHSYGWARLRKALKEGTFHEVYYGEAASIDPQPLFDKVERCLRNFLESRWCSWLAGDARRYRTQWVIEPGDYGQIRIGGLKAYCKVDFAFPTGDGLVHILEWKTGRPDRAYHNAQLRGYAAYARETFAKAPENIRPYLVYLDDPYEERSLPITEEDLGDLARTVRDQTLEMYGYCEDPQQNTPLPRERFPMTELPATCRFCNFRELCDR
jgi:CRISPR/Cas system-associated exonuclease Cas4 (RecB family)